MKSLGLLERAVGQVMAHFVLPFKANRFFLHFWESGRSGDFVTDEGPDSMEKVDGPTRKGSVAQTITGVSGFASLPGSFWGHPRRV